MAEFIVNSDSKQAVRKTEVSSLAIVQRDGTYALILRLSAPPVVDVIFEIDTTEAGILAKSASVLSSLETE